MKKPSLVNKIKLPLISDDSKLIWGQEGTHFPIKVRRIFYISGSVPGLPRGFHAHRVNKQIIFCIQGSLKLTLDNRKTRQTITLNKPNEGQFIDNLIWFEMHEFRKNTILLVLASELYHPEDYIRDYQEFRKLVSAKKNK